MNVGDNVIVTAKKLDGHEPGTHGIVILVEHECGDTYVEVLGIDGEWEGLTLCHLAEELKIDKSEGDK